MNYRIIDCHCHVYPSKIAEKAVESIHRFYDIPMDCDGTAESLRCDGEKYGVEHFVISSVATAPRQVESINAFIAKTVKESNGCMTGLGTLHPDSETIENDIRFIKESGLKGIKLHPDFQKFAVDSEKAFRIYELCKDELPVLMHTGDNRYDYSNAARVKNVLENFPGLTLIGAHLGGYSLWTEAWKTLCDYNNFYVDCSSSLFALSSQKATEIINAYGSRRVLFGSDYPMWSYDREVERFFKLRLTESQKQQILCENASEIFKI